MSRKPIDQTMKKEKLQGQDGVWAQVRALNIFTIKEIIDNTDINRKTVKDYINRLEAGGYIGPHTSFEETERYILMRDAGVHAPRIRKDGSPVTQGGGTENMWRTMRMMREFTPRDIALHATTDSVTVTEATARTYCTMMLKGKYLRVVKKAIPGKSQTLYKFVRNTGPLPPQIQRVKQVFDPNIREVTYYPHGDCA